MTIIDEIFRAYDIRGTLDQLSEELARHIGAAVVKHTGAKTVVVGRDMRETSPQFSAAVIEGIVGQGANVVDIGLCTTPMFKFAVATHEDHDAGVMITASHNPAEYNGFKMLFGNGTAISSADVKTLVAGEMPAAETKGSVEERDISEEYLDKIFSLVDPMPSLSGMKVVVDAGNGMGGVILPKLFARLDCEMTPLYFEPDGTFPNHEANPIKVETLKDLQAKVAEVQAHVGIGLDGDSDRIGFVDENGTFINGDRLYALLLSERLEGNEGRAIVWSPNATWAIRDAIAAHGGKSVMTKVGWANVAGAMAQENALMGGEVSAHYFYSELGNVECTELTMLLVLKKMQESGLPLSELMKPFNTYAASGEVNFEVSKKDEAIDALRNQFSEGATSVSDLDGIRIEFEDWWFNVRKSNTEPLVRLNMEAVTPELLEEKKSAIREVLTKYA